MKQTKIHVNNIECTVLADEDPRALIVQPVDDHDLQSLTQEIDCIKALTDVPFTLAALKIHNRNNDLTPWPAPSVFRNKPFGNGASTTLDLITAHLLPGLRGGACVTMLGGYSLAGLFALWAGYTVDCFDGIAAASPSLWYQDWDDFADKATMLARRVYLSLGRDEEKARNRTIATVGDAVRRQHSRLLAHGVDTVLEWNDGNHFQDPAGRTARAFASLLNRL